MQLLMRRPEIEGFISIAPPANLYDFSFLAPCPSSGMIVHGDKDAVVPYKDVTGLVDKLKTQKGIVIEQKVIPGANHFFDGKVEPLMQAISAYLDKRLKIERKPTAAYPGGPAASLRETGVCRQRHLWVRARRAPVMIGPERGANLALDHAEIHRAGGSNHNLHLVYFLVRKVSMGDVFKALASEPRRRILNHLAGRPDDGRDEIAEKFEMELPSISKHLSVLREGRLVSTSKSAASSYFISCRGSRGEHALWVTSAPSVRRLADRTRRNPPVAARKEATVHDRHDHHAGMRR
jgi:DNA-binding transcriptional ArsR family regulator